MAEAASIGGAGVNVRGQGEGDSGAPGRSGGSAAPGRVGLAIAWEEEVSMAHQGGTGEVWRWRWREGECAHAPFISFS